MSHQNTKNLNNTEHNKRPPLALIGASAGGPQILGELLNMLPRPLPFSVIIAQHLECDFMGDFINWLSRHSNHTCKLAEENSTPLAGTIYIADCHNHLTLDRCGRFIYAADPEDAPTPYRPGIDQLFYSAAQWWQPPGVAVLLTGMGSDGAKGLLQLRKSGWQTVAQDEKTSLVYGMPKAAAEIDAASEILEPEQIAKLLTNSLTPNTENKQ